MRIYWESPTLANAPDRAFRPRWWYNYGVKLDRRQLKFLVLGLGILLSMTYLIVVGMNRPGGAVYYLGPCGHPDAVAVLEDVLRGDRDKNVRIAAIHAPALLSERRR